MKWMSLLALVAMIGAAEGCGCCSCFRREEPVAVPVAPACPPAPVCDPCANPGYGAPPASAYSVPGTTTYGAPATTYGTPGPQL